MCLRQGAARRIKLIFGNDGFSRREEHICNVSRLVRSEEDVSVTQSRAKKLKDCSIWNEEDVEARASKVARGREIQARN